MMRPMRAHLRWFVGAVLASIGFVSPSFAAVTEQAPIKEPEWLSQVPVLKSGGDLPFQFRAILEMSGRRLIVYVSWAPPDHRGIVFCDGSDGLPLMIAVDGDGWMYDLVGGQIVHFESEPKFNLGIEGDQAEFRWGIVPKSQDGGMRVDLASFLRAPNTVELKATEDATGRSAAARSARGSKAVLQVTATDPPLPTKLLLSFPAVTPPGRMEFDALHFGKTLPRWHHPIDVETLKKDVPYVDAAQMDTVPKDLQELLEISRQLLFGEASFLLRPAIREPELRKKLEQFSNKLDFKQIELHEKLLKDAWLRALEHQGSNPAKFAPPLSPAWKE
jgi:hypothetical protein